MKINKLKALLLTALLLTFVGATSLAACSDRTDTAAARPTVEHIEQRGVLIVGTTGDYRPLTFCEPATGEYWGFGIELAEAIAARMGVVVQFVHTSWPTLTADVQAEPLEAHIPSMSSMIRIDSPSVNWKQKFALFGSLFVLCPFNLT